MPSAILIVTALFLCAALLSLFWAYYCQQVSLRQAQWLLARAVTEQQRSCMIWRKQFVNPNVIRR